MPFAGRQLVERARHRGGKLSGARKKKEEDGKRDDAHLPAVRFRQSGPEQASGVELEAKLAELDAKFEAWWRPKQRIA